MLRVLVLAGVLLAPFQCAHDVPPDRAREDTPGDALWDLAERFGESGDEASERRTLEFLVERYPDSRFAERSRMWLASHPSSAP